MLVYYRKEKNAKGRMFLSKILVHPCMITHCGRKHFCRYCLQASSTAEILKSHVNDCFKINGK